MQIDCNRGEIFLSPIEEDQVIFKILQDPP